MIYDNQVDALGYGQFEGSTVGDNPFVNQTTGQVVNPGFGLTVQTGCIDYPTVVPDAEFIANHGTLDTTYLGGIFNGTYCGSLGTRIAQLVGRGGFQPLRNSSNPCR